MTGRLALIGSMLRLVYPPRSSKQDAALVQALEQHNAVTQELSERADNVERALSNIKDATQGLFAQ